MLGPASRTARRAPSLRSVPAGIQRQSGWICRSCAQTSRAAVPARFARSFSSSSRRRDEADKPFYITTPIFYVNASPHVGHLYTMVLADAMKRWEVLKGQRKAYLCTGTDEHGMKVQRAAEQQDMPPKVFCDITAETFKDLARKANISNDYFIRTTDEDHREAVLWFWEQLQAKGYIYEAKHEGWYCVSDETFYPENMVEKRVHPLTGKQFMASIETGNEVEWTEEKNYHFRMTALRDKLLAFYDKNPEWLIPSARMAEVRSWVENNLRDLSISRPSNRLTWGIPVPHDPSQTIYVWVDALINYITKAGYPWARGDEHELGWPADVQVVGKDIVRFHCVYWPALLLAVGIPPPKRVVSHGHWLMDMKKMSKSVGNVVNPMFAIDRWGVDVMRYYLLWYGSYTNDMDYGNQHIVQLYKKALQSNLGNTLSRITGERLGQLNNVVSAVHGQSLYSFASEGGQGRAIAQIRNYAEAVNQMAANVTKLYDTLQPRLVQHELNDFAIKTNVFLTTTEPWRLNRKEERDLKYRIIYVVAERLRVSAILLQPIMPEKAAELLDRLGVDRSLRGLEYACYGVDETYGRPLIELADNRHGYGSLFPPLPVED